MKIIYICERPYNLYRTLLKAVNSDDEMDLVISNHHDGMELMLDELRESALFDNVYYFNGLKHKRFPSHLMKSNRIKEMCAVDSIRKTIISTFRVFSGFFHYMISQRKAKHITLPDGLDFDRYNEIHMTDCTSIINFYLYHKRYPNLVYVEHAKDALHSELGAYPKITDFLAILVKLRVIYGVRGSSRYIKAIEVNKNEKLIRDTRNKEIREVPLDTLIDALSLKQKELIFRLYAKSYNLNFPSDSIIDVFLTFYVDGETRSDVFLFICEEIIRQYMSDADFFVIKPHPKDMTDYGSILSSYKNAILVPNCFSAEIFALSSSFRIRKLINICTTSLSVFNSVDEILTLGIDFVVECRNRM